MRTSWNLKLLYSSPKDPAIEMDMRSIEEAAAWFSKNYFEDRRYLSDDETLLKALKEYESLISKLGGAKPLMYFFYIKSLKSSDKVAEKQINLLTERLHAAFNTIHFFELTLGKLPEENRRDFLSSPKLKDFKYYLKHIFLESKHHLSDKEEKIMTLKSLPAKSMWVNAMEKILNSKTVKFGGKELPLPEAENMINDLDTPKRRRLGDMLLETYKDVAPFAESELTAIATNKKIDDSLRGFKHPYSGTVLGYHNSEEGVKTLLETVEENVSISHSFYALKKKLLKLPYLMYSDRSAPIGRISKKFGYKEGVQILESSFGSVSKKYAELLKSFLKNGQIDFFPKKGKEGGAFMSGAIDLPSFVMLNYVNSFDSVMTFAHEMGHAIHTELSKTQSPIYQDYTLSAAEIASTFFENFAFDSILESLPPKERIVALHNKINGDIATIFRQTAFFRFENELHMRTRSEGALSHDEIARLFNVHMKSYLGPAFKLRELDGYFYVTVSHFRRFFYVYAYAYGSLISRALYRKFKDNPSYLSKIEKFLSSGGSASPDETLLSIGIDTSKKEFWEEGLKGISDDVATLKKLISKEKM